MEENYIIQSGRIGQPETARRGNTPIYSQPAQCSSSRPQRSSNDSVTYSPRPQRTSNDTATYSSRPQRTSNDTATYSSRPQRTSNDTATYSSRPQRTSNDSVTYSPPVSSFLTSQSQECNLEPALNTSVVQAEEAIAVLERGVVVTLASARRKPKTLTLCLRREQAELICVQCQGSQPLLSIDLCHLKEIVPESRQRLDRSNDEVLKEKADKIITLFCGATFMLQPITLTVAKERDHIFIVKALEVCKDNIKKDDPYHVKQRWLRREFSNIQLMNRGFLTGHKESSVSMKQIHTWFNQQTEKITRGFLTLTCGKLKFSGEVDFNNFCELVNEIMKPIPITERLMKEFGQPLPDGKRTMPLPCFENFLKVEQNDSLSVATELMLECLPPSWSLRTESPSFSANEFEDYLFSSINSILNQTELTVHQNMDQPLCNYWIASSHNTYLTSDQWKGESNVETYTRCLQMGCRCVELDCWDGPDGKPIITHGKTLTSKIRVADVLHTIKEHAWEVTDFPLILSIENHCSLPQQRLLATLFKEIFQNDLLTEQVDPNETRLPSPNQLKRKIIIKNKKLLRDWKYSDVKQYADVADLSDARKQGTMYMKYAREKNWNEYDVVLTDTHIGFTPHIPHIEVEDETFENKYQDYFENCEIDDDKDADDPRPLTSQLWYHGAIGRAVADLLLKEHCSHGDGTFLVRESGKGGIALSFFAAGSITHSMIKEWDNGQGQKLYLIGNEVWHNSIPDLIDYYYIHKLTYKEKAVSISLTYPVKRKFDFEYENWYSDLGRVSAEDFLKKINVDGVFLVRPSSEQNCFSLTMRYHRRISHYQIEFNRNRFVLGMLIFPTMYELIDYFTKHPLYKTAMLTQPASFELQNEGPESEFYTGVEPYCEVDQKAKLISVIALYDFHASSPDELSFKKGSCITNVIITDEPWWRGDHAGLVQKLFPANYVQIVGDNAEDEDSNKLSETMLRLIDCHISEGTHSQDGMHFFDLGHPTQTSVIHIGSKKSLEAEDWMRSVIDCKLKIGEESLELQKQERMKNIAQELSDIVVYCQAVPFNPNRSGKFLELSSFSEERIGRDDRQIILYNQFQISRVYPKFLRVTSTNFDPIPKWNVGCQLVALNYQTPDKPMQINQAMFKQNGGCGFVLKPKFMQNPHYNPSEIGSLKNEVESVVLTVTILGGRNLGNMTSAVGDRQPFVSVEVLGLPLDCQMERTRMSQDKNVLNPFWKNEAFIFHISCPDLAFVRFEVGSDGNDTSCLSQATFHLKSIRQGYRSVFLENAYSEPLPNSSLLVHINIRNPKEEEEKNVFRIVEETRKLYMELSTSDQNDKRKEQLQQTEQKLLEYLNRSRTDGYRRTWRH